VKSYCRRKLVAERCGRVERVGAVLKQLEFLRWTDRDADFLCPGFSVGVGDDKSERLHNINWCRFLDGKRENTYCFLAGTEVIESLLSLRKLEPAWQVRNFDGNVARADVGAISNGKLKRVAGGCEREMVSRLAEAELNEGQGEQSLTHGYPLFFW